MRKYKDFKEYMEDNYLDVIMERIEPYVVGHKSFFEDEDFYQIDWVELSDASVCGVTFKDLGDNWLEIRTSVDATVDITGRTKYGRDTDSVVKTFNVFFKGLLENGLHHVTVTDVTTYDKSTYNRDTSLSQNLVPYLYEEDVERYADDFLKRRCGKARLQPMPLPVEEIAEEMGMQIYYAPLDDNIFGMTYFGEEEVTVYTDISGTEEIKISITEL